MKHFLRFSLLTLLMAVCCSAWAEEKWVLTAPENLTTGDVVVIVDQTSSKAMSNNNGTQSAPSAVGVTLSADKSEISSEVAATIQWNVTRENGYYQFSTGDSYLYVTATNDGVRVSSKGARNTFVVATGGDNQGYYLLNSESNDLRYIGCYNSSNWRCYNTINNNIKGNENAFYKKVDSRQDPAFAFEPSSMTINQGDDSWPQPVFTSANNDYFIGDQAKATWTSDNQYVAYWTPQTGLVVTGTLGTANILVSFAGNDDWKPCETTLVVNVVDPRQDPAFSFTPSSINITKGDNSWTQPVFSCADEAFFITQGKMTCTSNHDVVAYWTPNEGLVLGSETGTATILVSYVGDDNWRPCEATLEVTVTEPTIYVKVTDASQLVAGNEYILVTDGGVAMSTPFSDNKKRNSVEVNLSDNKVSVKDEAVTVLTLGGSTDAWTFLASDNNQYLSYKGSSNELYSATETGNETNWKVTTDFQLVSANVTGRFLKYNSGSPRFACYANGQTSAYLYVKEGSTVGKTDVSTVTQLKTDLIVGQKFRVDDVIQWKDATDDRVSHNFGDWNNIELVDADHGLYAAVAAGEASFTGSFEYTPAAGQENPYNNVFKTFTFNVYEPITVAEALELTDLPKNVCVTGIISQIDEVNTEYGNASYWISDDGTTTNQMKVYRGKFLDGANFTANDQIAVGYTVTIIGQMQVYNEENQFAQGNSIVSLKKPICTMTQLLTEVTLGQEYNLYDIIQVVEAEGANPINISRGVGGYGDSFDYNTNSGYYKAVQEGPAQITLTWKYNPGEGNENPYTDVTKTFNLTIVNPNAVELLDLLSEKTTYTNEEDRQVEKVTYKREFSSKTAGHRQCWFVPFDYTITADDLERCTFYRIHMFSATSDQEGVVQDENKVVMKITEVTEGYTLKANKPYIIKPKAVGVYEFVAENATLKAMDSGSLKRVSTTTNDYNFYGVYDSYTTAEAEQWFSMNTNGNLQWNAANQKLGAYRWYITSTFTGDDYANIAFIIDEEGEETTAIDQLFADPNAEIEGVYTVDGMKLYKPAKGLNIVKYTDGRTKKVYIK